MTSGIKAKKLISYIFRDRPWRGYRTQNASSEGHTALYVYIFSYKIGFICVLISIIWRILFLGGRERSVYGVNLKWQGKCKSGLKSRLFPIWQRFKFYRIYRTNMCKLSPKNFQSFRTTMALSDFITKILINLWDILMKLREHLFLIILCPVEEN